jgi:hypothetical protein
MSSITTDAQASGAALLNSSTIITKGPVGAWFTLMGVLLVFNEAHSAFRSIFFDQYRALLNEQNHESYVHRLAGYLRLIQSEYMFVRVERPRDSRCFVMGYIKCDRVFSFQPRYEQMRLRLSRVPGSLLANIETGEHRDVRVACIGETDFELALAQHRNPRIPPLHAAIVKMDEDAIFAFLDGGVDPNDVDTSGRNALHALAFFHATCSVPLAQKVLEMIEDVNLQDRDGYTALMNAVMSRSLIMFEELLKESDKVRLDLQDNAGQTALHIAASKDHEVWVKALIEQGADVNLKDAGGLTPLRLARSKGSNRSLPILTQATGEGTE